MRRKAWAFGGAGAAVVIIVVALVERHAAAQAGRPQVPLFEPDPLWSQALPNKWVTGQVGGLAVDSHDNLWVFHRPATIPDGEKAASLVPPQAECCIPRQPCWNSTRTENSSRRGAAPGRATSGRPRSTESSSMTKITCG